jgi:Protein of unknown function (DUF3102)
MTALADPILVEHADAIRALGKRVIADVIEIGRRLVECKRICGHGNWLPWLDREFGWSADTAERFIQISALANEIPQVAEFAIPISGLYLLAAPSTPTEARDAIIERAQAGKPVPVAEVKCVIDTTKGRKRSAKKPTKKSVRKPEPVDAAPVTSPKKRSMAQAIREHTVGADMYVAAKTLWHKMPLPDQERFLSYLAASLEVERAIAPGGYDGTAFVLKRASEAERLQVRTRELEDEVRRCEIQIVGLKSEIDELKAARASEHPDVKGAQPADQEPAAADPFDIPPMLDRNRAAP